MPNKQAGTEQFTAPKLVPEAEFKEIKAESVKIYAYANRVLLDLMHTEVDFHSALYKPKDTGISELFDSAVLRVGKPAREMNKADRLRVIEYLSSMDAFSYRRAVPYVASHLGVSRYTVYKYLDEVNGKINKASAKDKED